MAPGEAARSDRRRCLGGSSACKRSPDSFGVAGRSEARPALLSETGRSGFEEKSLLLRLGPCACSCSGAGWQPLALRRHGHAHSPCPRQSDGWHQRVSQRVGSGYYQILLGRLLALLMENPRTLEKPAPPLRRASGGALPAATPADSSLQRSTRAGLGPQTSGDFIHLHLAGASVPGQSIARPRPHPSASLHLRPAPARRQTFLTASISSMSFASTSHSAWRRWHSDPRRESASNVRTVSALVLACFLSIGVASILLPCRRKAPREHRAPMVAVRHEQGTPLSDVLVTSQAGRRGSPSSSHSPASGYGFSAA